jgi:hypothetical protein
VSDIVTDCAADGPTFVTLISYENVCPGETDVPTVIFVVDRSALASSRSVTRTLVASDGPLFLIWSV